MYSSIFIVVGLPDHELPITTAVAAVVAAAVVAVVVAVVIAVVVAAVVGWQQKQQ